MPSRRKPLIDKKGIIELEQAKQRFHDYYNTRTKSKIGRLRAKMFDIKYQKKPQNVLTPGQPGSAKYLLEEGPRTFDMVGVDYFPEGERIDIDDPEYENISIVSSGSTNKRDDTDDPDELERIYGPRIKNTKRLYSKHFGDKFRGRREDGDLKDKKLIEIYWEKYKENPNRYRRKNKREQVDEEDVVEVFVDDQSYFIMSNGNIYNDLGENIGNLDFNTSQLFDIKEEIIEALNDLDLLEELEDEKYVIDQNVFRMLLIKQKLERGENNSPKASRSKESSIILDEPSSSSKSSTKSKKSTIIPEEPSSSRKSSTKSKKSSRKSKESEDSSEESLLDIDFGESSKASGTSEASEEEASEASDEEASEASEEESEASEEEESEALEISPGLNIDKSTDKKYNIEGDEEGNILIKDEEDNLIVKANENLTPQQFISLLKSKGINYYKLKSIEEEQSGGTYFDEISIDEYELRELEKLAGLR